MGDEGGAARRQRTPRLRGSVAEVTAQPTLSCPIRGLGQGREKSPPQMVKLWPVSGVSLVVAVEVYLPGVSPGMVGATGGRGATHRATTRPSPPCPGQLVAWVQGREK